MNLFDEPPAPVDPRTVPLAERMRPRALDDIVGQEEIIARGRPLRDLKVGDSSEQGRESDRDRRGSPRICVLSGRQSRPRR